MKSFGMYAIVEVPPTIRQAGLAFGEVIEIMQWQRVQLASDRMQLMTEVIARGVERDDIKKRRRISRDDKRVENAWFDNDDDIGVSPEIDDDCQHAFNDDYAPIWDEELLGDVDDVEEIDYFDLNRASASPTRKASRTTSRTSPAAAAGDIPQLQDDAAEQVCHRALVPLAHCGCSQIDAANDDDYVVAVPSKKVVLISSSML